MDILIILVIVKSITDKLLDVIIYKLKLKK